MTVSPARARLARLRASLWRFRNLAYAERLFAGAPAPTVLTRPYFGYPLHLDVSRTNAQRLLYLEGERLMLERPVLEGLLAPGAAVVDVGANLGYYTLFFEHRIGPGGRIVALEPEPENLVELRRNIAANGFTNVEVLACAAGREAGTVQLRRGINGAVVEGLPPGGEGDTVNVPVVPLDAVIRGKVDLLKIDVEGYEGHVLDGARGLLSTRPNLFVEIHPELMAAPYTVESVVAMVAATHADLEAWLPSSPRGAWGKLAARYLGGASCERARDLAALVAASMRGERRDPFWLVGRR